MCRTPAAGTMSPTSAFRHRKRAIKGTDNRRPAKRVSFSKCDKVLGTAQDYDRTSFEMPQRLRRRRVAPCTPPQQQSTPSSPNADDDTQQKQNANFCGMWRRSHGFNWASLLLFSGVDEDAIEEQAAKMQSSSVVHLIDHDATSFRLAVHSDTGSTQDQHFFIGGQPRPNSSASSTMLSSMRWAKGGQALVLSSIDAATGDEMTVSRHLASQGSVLVQHYTARRAKTGETAEAITIFRKVVRGGGGGGGGGGSDSSDSSDSSRPN